MWRGGVKEAGKKKNRENGRKDRDASSSCNLENFISPLASDDSVFQRHMAWESCSFPFHRLILMLADRKTGWVPHSLLWLLLSQYLFDVPSFP